MHYESYHIEIKHIKARNLIRKNWITQMKSALCYLLSCDVIEQISWLIRKNKLSSKFISYYVQVDSSPKKTKSSCRSLTLKSFRMTLLNSDNEPRTTHKTSLTSSKTSTIFLAKYGRKKWTQSPVNDMIGIWKFSQWKS